MIQLAVNLYTDVEDKQASEAIVDGIISASRCVNHGALDSSSDFARCTQVEGPSGQEKLAYYIVIRFCDNNTKLFGDRGESWI